MSQSVRVPMPVPVTQSPQNKLICATRWVSDLGLSMMEERSFALTASFHFDQQQDVECQRWTNNQSDECHCTDNQSEECHWTDNQSDEEGCSTDLYRHPQLDMDIDSVKAIYTDTAVSVRHLLSVKCLLSFNTYGKVRKSTKIHGCLDKNVC
ncbi:unnamed protein product [Coregonus sp. 'balchen']|nr:unnamed protein product [Coregonus sp. 'balchen']